MGEWHQRVRLSAPTSLGGDDEIFLFARLAPVMDREIQDRGSSVPSHNQRCTQHSWHLCRSELLWWFHWIGLAIKMCRSKQNTQIDIEWNTPNNLNVHQSHNFPNFYKAQRRLVQQLMKTFHLFYRVWLFRPLPQEKWISEAQSLLAGFATLPNSATS